MFQKNNLQIFDKFFNLCFFNDEVIFFECFKWVNIFYVKIASTTLWGA